MSNIGQMELKLVGSSLQSTTNTISNTWQIRKLYVENWGYPQGGQFLTLVITLENSHGVAQKHKGYNFRFPPHKFNGQQSVSPQPSSTENTTIEFDKQHYIDGVVKVIGQLYEWSPSWQHTGLHGTEAMIGRPWSYPVTTTLNFEPPTAPTITEEVTVDAPQEITLDSIVSGITQAVTVQEAAAEPQVLGHTPPPPTLSQETKKIIDDWSTKKIIVPNWFANNNINWVLQGKITEEEFIAGYTNLLNTGVITIPTAPKPTPPAIDTSTSLTMISQKWDYFDIVDGRAKGQITFRATSDFNPYYYGKELVNYMQLVNNQGLTIVLKPNVLRFTQTEQDETIQYDEGVGDLKSVKVESYVWTHDNQPMSSLYTFPIYDGKPPGTGTGELARTDFLAKIGGVIAGSLAIALLLPKRIGN